jgi:alginate production protein
VGNEIDIIVGFRNLFGFRRFGLELRMGWFLPGKAYRVPEGDPDNPTYRKADQAITVLGVIII